MLTSDDAGIIKGMLARGDKQQEIVASFGGQFNPGRISEINTGKRFSEVQAINELDLPPKGEPKYKRISFNNNNKFDIQLSASLLREKKLAGILGNGKIELKSENWQWERTGNICIEYQQNGKPSGIAVTEADIWCHELRREDRTLVYLFFPVERLKELARQAIKAGRSRIGGDGGRFKVALIAIKDILR